MKQLITEDEAVGKTVELMTFEGSYIAVLFDDGTAMVNEYEYDHDGGYYCSVYRTDAIGLYNQHMLGLLTGSEYAEALDARNQKNKEATEALERRQYESLKKKYGE